MVFTKAQGHTKTESKSNFKNISEKLITEKLL